MNQRQILRELAGWRDIIDTEAKQANHRAISDDAYASAYCAGKNIAYCHCRNMLDVLIARIEGDQ